MVSCLGYSADEHLLPFLATAWRYQDNQWQLCSAQKSRDQALLRSHRCHDQVTWASGPLLRMAYPSSLMHQETGTCLSGLPALPRATWSYLSPFRPCSFYIQQDFGMIKAKQHCSAECKEWLKQLKRLWLQYIMTAKHLVCPNGPITYHVQDQNIHK
jgi:hypothetical protein